MDSKAYPTQNTVLRKAANWRNLYFYQKADTLYQITYIFCDRFLPKFGDRTVDQMTQAARSGKQNIVEGSEDGKTSTEMELKLLNVARSSIQELREDYADYLKTRNLPYGIAAILATTRCYNFAGNTILTKNTNPSYSNSPTKRWPTWHSAFVTSPTR
jgi:four helix bundle protein